MEFILWGLKKVAGFIWWGTLHSLSLTSAGIPRVVGYPRLLIQRNRTCHPPPAGRLCQQQPKGPPYHTNNSRHLSQRRSLWNVVPLYPHIYMCVYIYIYIYIYIYTHTHTHTHRLTHCKVWCSVETGLHNFLWYNAVSVYLNTIPCDTDRSQVHTLFLWRHSSS
jgi:hypothetical protein